MKRILVVEDDKKIAKAMTIRLEASGYDVAVAHDAVIATTTARNFLPDLILLDIMLPGGNGLMLSERFKEIDHMVDVPIIFITASKRPELKQKAMKLGAADFIEKPFDSSHLLCSVAQQIQPAC